MATRCRLRQICCNAHNIGCSAAFDRQLIGICSFRSCEESAVVCLAVRNGSRHSEGEFSMLRTLGLSLVTAAALAGTALAASNDGMIRKDVQVYYHDLDLRTDAGARMMLVRISNAAKEACGNPMFYSSYSVAPSYANQVFAKCQAEAIQRAVISLNAPAVNKIYAQNSNAQAPRLASY
jgi:UrcA family protein